MRKRYYDDYFGESVSMYCDLEGRPVERTPRSHPYSYGEFVLYKSERFDPMDCMVYHDRMLQWDRAAFSKSVREVWPDRPQAQIFSGKKPEDIGRFLCLYFGKQVELTAVLQGCNAGNGCPYWVFAYKEVEQEGGDDTNAGE